MLASRLPTGNEANGSLIPQGQYAALNGSLVAGLHSPRGSLVSGNPPLKQPRLAEPDLETLLVNLNASRLQRGTHQLQEQHPA